MTTHHNNDDKKVTLTEAEMRSLFEPIPQPSLPLPALTRSMFTPTLKALPDDELVAHIVRVRDQAFARFKYPCLGRFQFITPGLETHPAFEKVVSLLRAPKASSDEEVPRFLDLGCGLAQDVRSLLKHGVPGERIVCSDLETKFFQLGCEMFGDETPPESGTIEKGRLAGVTFLSADVFSENDMKRLLSLNGGAGYHIIYIGSFLHLFPLELQQKIAITLEKLLSKKPGSMIVGRQMGAIDGHASTMVIPSAKIGSETTEERNSYRHDSTTIRELFTQASPSFKAHVPQLQKQQIHSNPEEAKDAIDTSRPNEMLSLRLLFDVTRE